MKMQTWLKLFNNKEAKKKEKAKPFKKKKDAEDEDESAAFSGSSALYRAGKESKRSISESIAVVASNLEGPRVQVVLLTEGLGNLTDKNYYGPEAVNSMPAAFEGAVCMLNHPSYTEERDRPEGEVQRTLGYYKNLRVESVGGRLGCVGELHFDRSPEGQAAYQKALTAIHYKDEFPGSGKEYVGLSVNAQGDSEPREMMVEGEMMDVNYVLGFVEARSCDMVTLPARGGRIVALVESVAGAQINNKEVRTMIVKRLRAAQAALKEAMSEKDPDLRGTKISEAQKEVDSLLKDTLEAASRAKKPAKATEGKKGYEDEDEAEDESESRDGKGAGDMEAAEAGEDDPDVDGNGDSPDSHTVTKHTKTVVKKTGKAATGGEDEDEDESKESHRLAVLGLIEASGINKKYFDLVELNSMTFKEAKKEISRAKRMHEAATESVLATIDAESAGGHVERTREAGGKPAKASNDDMFPDLTVL